MMEYVNYILALLVFGLLCIQFVRKWGRNHDGKAKLRHALQRKIDTVASSAYRQRDSNLHGTSASAGHIDRRILKRELQKVPTPWGWSRYQELNGRAIPESDLSAALHSFTNRLLRQKELVSSQSGDPRISDSFRALLEDRYGPVNRRPREPITYEKVKRPLLRDPSEPHDQMDNFGTGEADRVRRKIQRFSGLKADPEFARGKARQIELKDVKQPWGW